MGYFLFQNNLNNRVKLFYMVEKHLGYVLIYCFDLIEDYYLDGLLYSKFSFGEVYRRMYGRKFSFSTTPGRGHKKGFPTVYPTIYPPPQIKF